MRAVWRMWVLRGAKTNVIKNFVRHRTDNTGGYTPRMDVAACGQNDLAFRILLSAQTPASHGVSEAAAALRLRSFSLRLIPCAALRPARERRAILARRPLAPEST